MPLPSSQWRQNRLETRGGHPDELEAGEHVGENGRPFLFHARSGGRRDLHGDANQGTPFVMGSVRSNYAARRANIHQSDIRPPGRLDGVRANQPSEHTHGRLPRLAVSL